MKGIAFPGARRTIRKGVFFTMALLVLCGLFGCGKKDDLIGTDGAGPSAPDNESGVVALSFTQSSSPRGDQYTYVFKQEGDGVLFLYTSLLFTDDEEKSVPADGAVLGKLTDLYRSLRLAEWDGFNKSDRSVLDGTDFSLSVTFADGKTLYAAGSNAFPERYGTFRDELEKIARPLRESIGTDA